MRSILLAVVLLGLLVPLGIFARIGVGVGLGKIIIEEPLKLGQIHDLPSLPIINTGTEPSDYTVQVEFTADKTVLRPSRDWFTFTPDSFHLEPGEVQVVKVRLALPLGQAEPGEYFAFLQGKPVYKDEGGGVTRIGIAAAVKLSFTVVPSNFFQALQYRIRDLAKLWMPWTYIVPGLLVFAGLLLLFKKFFSFNIGIGVKQKSQSKEKSRGPRSKKVGRKTA